MNYKSNLIGILLVFGLSPAVYAESIDRLAEELVRLRGEVEDLQGELDLAKEDHRNKMAALNSQIADLGVEERRQNVSLEKMQQALVKFEESKAETTTASENLPPVIQASIVKLYDYVEASAPFKKQERLEVLKKLQSDLTSQLIDVKRAANRLWAFVEDEIRLSKENGVYRQTIDLDGEKVLADVAKIGSIMLYFQTSDRRTGMAQQKENGQWYFVELTDNQSKEQISYLFDTLKKQIRQGYFELPNPLGT